MGRPDPATLLRVAPGLITGAELAPLRAEARDLRPSATRRERRERAAAPDGRMVCALRNWFAGDGAAVQREVREVLCPRLAAMTGEPLVPTHSSYLYYGRGDFLGLHRDHPTCVITVLLWLSGPAGDLRVHPELADVPDREIDRLAARWRDDPPGGINVDLQDGPVVLRGSVVPHHRPPHPYDDELSIATFCFTARS